MEQNWREYNKQDNYESSSVDPCQTCKHRHYEKSKNGFDWASVWFGLLLICGLGCFVLFTKWQDDEAKLKNCVYYDENTGSVHSVKNGDDWTVLDSDCISEFNDLFNDLFSDD